MSPPSISISAILELRGLGDAGQAGLRAFQNQGDGSRRVGQVGAFQLKGGLGAPHAHVGLGVGVQIVDGGDQLARRARAGGEDLAESVRLAVLASATVKYSGPGSAPMGTWYSSWRMVSAPFSPVRRTLSCTFSPGADLAARSAMTDRW